MVAVGGQYRANLPACAGFTLIEMLVVLLLVALLSATLIGGLTLGRTGSLTREADRLAALLQEGALQARATGSAMVWRAAGSHYDFIPAALADEPEIAGRPDDPRRPVYRLDDDVRIVAVRNGEAQSLARLTLAGRGIAPPATITLASAEQEIDVRSEGLDLFKVSPLRPRGAHER